MAAVTDTVVIIIPTYNEQGNIKKVLEILFEHIFPKIPDSEMHILVVDDSSPDGTGRKVQLLSKKYARLHLLNNGKKLGLGNAYIQGMQYALNQLKADVVFEFDADLSHDPEKIPEMLKKISDGYDLVLGSRYIPGGGIPANWGWHRKFLSVAGNWVARILAMDFKVHDWTGGFRGIKKEVVATVLQHLNQDELMGYTFQIGFLLQARKLKYKVTEVPFHFKDRTLGKSKMPASYITNTLSYLVKVRWNDFIGSRIFKFAIVGLIGAGIQLSSLQVLRSVFRYQLAYFLSVEMAVLSNFIWSNWWTFADRKLEVKKLPGKFLQFNLASAGSILIQQVLAFLGEKYVGLFELFRIPIVNLGVDTGLIIAITGILLGMIWNFMAYSKIVWRNKRL